MTKAQKITSSLLCLFLCILFIVSVIDTNEVRQQTNFDQSRVLEHIEKLCENGPRSLAHKEANQKAIDYIASTIASYGLVNEDTTEKPAYLVQDYIGRGDSRYQNWYSQNVIAYIPANGANPS